MGHAHGCWRQDQNREEVNEKGMRLKETVRVERRESEPCGQETEVKRMKEVEKKERKRDDRVHGRGQEMETWCLPQLEK